jgi:hypothetical protein
MSREKTNTNKQNSEKRYGTLWNIKAKAITIARNAYPEHSAHDR